MRALKSLMIASAIIVLSVVSFAGAQEPKNDLLVQHNQLRAMLPWNRPCLTLDPQLCAAAQFKAEQMGRVGRMEHWVAGGHMNTVRQVGYAAAGAGENIAVGQADARSVTQTWWHSHGHRNNMLGNWRDVGFGHYQDGQGRHWWCAIFANRHTDPKPIYSIPSVSGNATMNFIPAAPCPDGKCPLRK